MKPKLPLTIESQHNAPYIRFLPPVHTSILSHSTPEAQTFIQSANTRLAYQSALNTLKAK